MNKNKKGFTLVELMVVVAVIAILATALLVGLGGARKRARDARRVSDLRQVQNVLELYYAKTGSYPDSGWDNLSPALTEGDDAVTTQLPEDPVNDESHQYEYWSNGENYVLKATLENIDNTVLDSDIDNSDLVGDLSGASGNIDCGSDDDSEGYYCVAF